jgi:hypothetical protein
VPHEPPVVNLDFSTPSRHTLPHKVPSPPRLLIRLCNPNLLLSTPIKSQRAAYWLRDMLSRTWAGLEMM